MRLLFFLLLAGSIVAPAQRSFGNSDWSAPFPPHRVIGPVHYVGTADLACFLITSKQGHILINTGLTDSAAQIRKNIQTLGFKLNDVKILLTNQAHFDHVAAMAEIRKATGARMLATEPDKDVLEDGGRSDFYLGSEHAFQPVKVDGLLKDGETVTLGEVKLRTHLTPGHTKGSVTYSLRVNENGRDYNVAIANIPTVIGAKLIGNDKYPGIAGDYARSFRVLKALACDVFLAAHGSQYQLKSKYKPAYSPNTFVDPEGFKRALAEAERKFEEQLTQERAKVR